MRYHEFDNEKLILLLRDPDNIILQKPGMFQGWGRAAMMVLVWGAMSLLLGILAVLVALGISQLIH